MKCISIGVVLDAAGRRRLDAVEPGPAGVGFRAESHRRDEFGSVLAVNVLRDLNRRGARELPTGLRRRARRRARFMAGAPHVPPEALLLNVPAERAAIVRFSRSLGVPRPLPDLLGLSIRVLDAYGDGRHQDFLLVTSFDLPVLNRILVCARDVQQRPYSSGLPYRAGSRRFVVGALPEESSPRPDGADEFDRLARAAATGRMAFALGIASLGGRFDRVATLHVDEPLPVIFDALRFDPFNTGGGLRPAGLLNRLRDYAYPMSQRSWARTGGRGEDQRRADAALRMLARET
ncbi:MAG: hypothetical protein LC790_05480 [Actinobacteria bacterium]|nr:hypothetical protein [Actinomycetota bacterium]